MSKVVLLSDRLPVPVDTETTEAKVAKAAVLHSAKAAVAVDVHVKSVPLLWSTVRK